MISNLKNPYFDAKHAYRHKNQEIINFRWHTGIKMGVVNFFTFPSTFLLRTFFGVSVPLKLTIGEEISLPPLSSRFTDYHALITGII